jgi:hypothetical protein
MAQDEAPPAGETPIQRALRLKKAAMAAKPEPGGRSRGGGEWAAAARSSAKSKPWMKK